MIYRVEMALNRIVLKRILFPLFHNGCFLKTKVNVFRREKRIEKERFKGRKEGKKRKERKDGTAAVVQHLKIGRSPLFSWRL